MKKLLIDIPTAACHASTVVRTPSGYAVAWFGGTAEHNSDVGIYAVYGTADGFSEPVHVSREDGIAHWNPVLWRRLDGTLLLYYKVGAEIPDWVTYVARSADDGRTWSEPSPLVPGDTSGGRGPVKNKPLRLSDGTVLAPASCEQGPWRAFFDRSEDDGLTYARTAFIETPEVNGKPVGVIQPTLWESRPGHVHALMRSDAGALYRTDSDDAGLTWCRAYATPLANNNSGVDLTKLSDGSMLLACNPVRGNWAARTPLVLLRSRNGGESWKPYRVLEDDPGEYSYPAVIDAGDGRAAVTYTWDRRKVAFCEFSF